MKWCWVAATALVVLGGCATYQPVPIGYGGPTAILSDTGAEVEPVFVLHPDLSGLTSGAEIESLDRQTQFKEAEETRLRSDRDKLTRRQLCRRARSKHPSVEGEADGPIRN